jgi:hypothetical protein
MTMPQVLSAKTYIQLTSSVKFLALQAPFVASSSLKCAQMFEGLYLCAHIYLELLNHVLSRQL